MMSEIVAVELTKTKAGARAVKIVIKTTDGSWMRDFIGEAAPSFVSDRYWQLLNISRGWTAFASDEAFDLYWKLLNISRGWASFASEEAFELIGLVVDIDTEEGDYGLKVTGIRMLGSTTANVIDDDIPF